MLFHCGLKVFNLRTEKKFWLTVSTNGKLTFYVVDGMIFAFFDTGWDVADCDWSRTFFKNGYCFSIS